MLNSHGWWSSFLFGAGFFVSYLLAVPGSLAAVDRIEIYDRSVVADGKAFGRVGTYIRISGKLHYSVDPENPANSEISDLRLAPKDERGRVNFRGDFVLLTPLDPSRRNNRLLYDVTHRGNMMALSRFNNATGRDGARSAADMGNGFLLEQGYSILWTGWNWDVRPRQNSLTIDLPIARQEDGLPITGQIVSEILTTTPTTSVRHIPQGSIGYLPVRMDDPNAQLSVRNAGDSQYTSIPRQSWRFGRPINATPDGIPLNDPTWITFENGFEPGRAYRLQYQSRNPVVVGLGLAAIRDALSFFRFENEDTTGNANPLTENGASLPVSTLVFGASQSGRVLNTLLWHGLHVDENGRMTFDGAIIDTAAASKGGFNFRFAQTSNHSRHDGNLDFPTDYFPFSTMQQNDTVLGLTGSLLDRARTLNAVPRLFIVNTSTDYWARSASLIHTETDGSLDIEPDDSVRLYVIAGAQHVMGVPDKRGILVHCRSPVDTRPVMRALLSHLDAWVTLDRSPPPSRYPRIDDDTLITLDAYHERFPDAPFLRAPSDYLRPPRLDLGPRFESDGIVDRVPPVRGAPYTTLVPAPDTDGMDIAGIRLPDIDVPLGTHTGWNPQNAATGAPDRLSGWFGSFIPFARTIPERESLNDPRPAITERYVSKADYRSAFAEATLNLAREELILGIDINPMIEAADTRYDRVMSRSPNDESCGYLTGP